MPSRRRFPPLWTSNINSAGWLRAATTRAHEVHNSAASLRSPRLRRRVGLRSTMRSPERKFHDQGRVTDVPRSLAHERIREPRCWSVCKTGSSAWISAGK